MFCEWQQDGFCYSNPQLAGKALLLAENKSLDIHEFYALPAQESLPLVLYAVKRKDVDIYPEYTLLVEEFPYDCATAVDLCKGTW